MRVLQQLATDDGQRFPAAVPIIEIYVDDTLFGQDSFHELHETREQLIDLMRGGGFQLQKWAANSPILLEDIPASQHELVEHLLARDEALKILGFSWLPQEDAFRFDSFAGDGLTDSTFDIVVRRQALRSPGCTCCHHRKDSASRALAAQE
jgi:hypothetical protein